MPPVQKQVTLLNLRPKKVNSPCSVVLSKIESFFDFLLPWPVNAPRFRLEGQLGGRENMAALPADSWEHKAACRGPQSEVFFPPPRFERKDEKIAREGRAKAICRQCSVMDDCLSYALDIREPHGIWGGANEAERRQALLALDTQVAS